MILSIPRSDADHLEATGVNNRSSDATTTNPSLGKICLSPFSSFLNPSSQSNAPGTSSPSVQTPTATIIWQLPSISAYVTNSDVVALGQRIQVLGYEVTTSVSSKLLE